MNPNKVFFSFFFFFLYSCQTASGKHWMKLESFYWSVNNYWGILLPWSHLPWAVCHNVTLYFKMQVDFSRLLAQSCWGRSALIFFSVTHSVACIEDQCWIRYGHWYPALWTQNRAILDYNKNDKQSLNQRKALKCKACDVYILIKLWTDPCWSEW